MQRVFVTVVLATGLIAAGCSEGAESGDGPDSLASEAAETAAEVDVEGVPSGCGALMAVGDTLEGPPEQVFTKEGLANYATVVAEAKKVTSGESQAATDYLKLVLDTTYETLDAIKADPAMPADEVALTLYVAAGEREDEIAELEAETLAYLDRRCDGLIDTSAGLTSGSTAGRPSGRPDDTPAENATSMDGDSGTEDTGTSTVETEPIAPLLEVETSSTGAAGAYRSLDLEVGEIWRTNQQPVDVLTGTGDGDGSDQSWMLVEVRLTNERGGDTNLSAAVFQWVDAAGSTTNATTAYTPNGEQWGLRFPPRSSERGYIVFSGDLGKTEGASLQIVGSGEVSESVPLGQGATELVYPFALSDGDSGEVTVETTSSCGYTADTDIRSAEIALNAQYNDRWHRVGDGRRFVVIDLGVSLRDSPNPAGCPDSIALFQLESRLKLSSGDLVAPLEMNFAAVNENATEVDRLVFEVTDDVTSMTLEDSNGEVLASWADLSFPTP